MESAFGTKCILAKKAHLGKLLEAVMRPSEVDHCLPSVLNLSAMSLSKRAKTNMDPTDSERNAAGDEHLPLYEEFEHSTADNHTLPGVRATPDEVRHYLVHLLTSKRDLPLDHVRRVVARWRIGTGIELRSYSPAMYLDIFGREDGWVIYREVRLAVLEQRSFAQKHITRTLPLQNA